MRSGRSGLVLFRALAGLTLLVLVAVGAVSEQPVGTGANRPISDDTGALEIHGVEEDSKEDGTAETPAPDLMEPNPSDEPTEWGLDGPERAIYPDCETNGIPNDCEAHSRAISVRNETPNIVTFNEAHSRAATVRNETADVVTFNEAHSRAVTVRNETSDVVTFNEAHARAFTVRNETPNVVTFNEAHARAFTVRNETSNIITFNETHSRAVTACNSEAGLDLFPTIAAFKLRFLNGSILPSPQDPPLVFQDPATAVGRSAVFLHGGPEELGAPIPDAAQYPGTALLAPESCRIPAGFPTSGNEVHTEILSLNLESPQGYTIKVGKPFYDSAITSGVPWYQHSFGEVAEVPGCATTFTTPAPSFFNVFFEADIGITKLYNKTPLVLQADIFSFPPRFELPSGTYLHDPSFPAVPLVNSDGIHVAYLRTAGHGEDALLTAEAPGCESKPAIFSTVAFAVADQSVGVPAGVAEPNHVRGDTGLPVQQMTVYASSGATPGASFDVTNARVPGLIGLMSTRQTPGGGGTAGPAPVTGVQAVAERADARAARPAGGSLEALPDVGFQSLFAPGDRINALSNGRDGTINPFTRIPSAGLLEFSVDRNSQGLLCTDVDQEAQRNQAAGDIFGATTPEFGNYLGQLAPRCGDLGDSGDNCLAVDQTGLGLSPPGASANEDDLVALEVSAFGPSDRVYLTLTGPTFNTNGAAVLVFDPQDGTFSPDHLTTFASAASMGLLPLDVIDALALSDTPGSSGGQPNGVLDAGADQALFSLAPGSPTLTALGASAADIFITSFTGAPPAIYASAAMLGLRDTDNVDAIDIAPAIIPNDCNANGIQDLCDVDRQFSQDCNNDRTPDECQVGDCNQSGALDTCDISQGTSDDVNFNGIPDECESFSIDLVVNSVDASAIIGVTDYQDTLEIAGSISAMIENRGGRAAQGPITVAFFEDANSNGVFNADVDALLGSTAAPGLAAGASLMVTAPVAGSVLFRDNVIHAFVDSTRAVAEAVEGNNTAASSMDCMASPRAGGAPAGGASAVSEIRNPKSEIRDFGGSAAPDFTASYLRVGLVDAGVLLTARIGNGGAATVPVGLGVSFHDGDPVLGDMLAATTTSVPLCPGTFEDVSVIVSATVPTQGFVWVRADATAMHAECDETNNVHNSGITLDPPNLAPLADAGGPYSTLECQSVTLDALASFDPNGDALSFAWDLDGDGQFDDSTDPAPEFSRNVAGNYPVRVQVSDGLLQDTDEATVSVVDQTPALSMSGPPTLTGDQIGCFAAAPAAGCAATIEWDWDYNVQAGFAGSGDAGFEACRAFAEQGDYIVAARVTDFDGDTGIATLPVSVREPIFNVRVLDHMIEVIYERHSYIPATGRHLAEVSVKNVGATPVREPIVVAFDQLAPTGTTLVDPDGILPFNGLPYIDFTPLLGDNFLDPGERTAAIVVYWQIAGSDAQFSFVDTPYALNSTPRFVSTPITTASEGGLYRYVALVEDAESDPLFYELLQSPAGMLISARTGVLRWTPGQTDAGTHDVHIRVTDGYPASSAAQSFQVVVGQVNVAPQITSTPNTTTNGVEWCYPIAAEDGDGDAVTVALQIGPPGMALGGGNVLCWTPSGPGHYLVRIIASDGVHTTVQEFALTVLACASPPDIVSTPILAATEGQPYAYPVQIDLGFGSAVTFSLAVAPAGMVINPSTGTITWTPGQQMGGPRLVKAVAAESVNSLCRDEQIFTIAVAAVNVAPVFVSTANTNGVEGGVYLYQAAAQDADGDPLTYTLTQKPGGMSIHPATGRIQWIPPQTAAAGSPYSVTVVATDPDGATATQTYLLQVAVSDLAPQITSIPVYVAIETEQYLYDVEAVDGDGDPLTYALVAGEFPTGMTIHPSTGVITWTPGQTAARDNPHVVHVVVSDPAGATAHQSYSIFVRATNLPPVISPIPAQTVDEGTDFFFAVQVQDGDVDDTLTYDLVAPPSGLYINELSGVIEWRPVSQTAATGSPYTVVVEVTDGFVVVQESFEITVNAVNVPPEWRSLPGTIAAVGTPFEYHAQAFDADQDVLTYSLAAAPAGMTIDPGTGLVQWTPAAGQLGPHSMLVQVDDGHGAVVPQGPFTITVLGDSGNQPPQILGTPVFDAAPGARYVYQVQASDPNGDMLRFALEARPDPAMNIDSNGGAITWTPGVEYLGVHDVTVRVEDGRGGYAWRAYPLTVANFPSNRPPRITSPPGRTAQIDTPYSYAVQAVDDDGDTLNFAVTGPPGMTIGLTTGLVAWTPTAADLGAHPVSVTVADGRGGSAVQDYVLTVSVSGANLAPRITSLPLLGAIVNFPYAYQVVAEDENSDPLEYRFIGDRPAGMNIDTNGGQITWTPQAGQVGDHPVTVAVRDDESAQDTQSFIVTVYADLGADVFPPEVEVTAEPRVVNPGEPVTLTVLATDDFAVATLELNVVPAAQDTGSNGEPVALNALPQGVYVPAEPGPYVARATVTDLAGHRRSATTDFAARIPGDETAPIAEITTPEEGAVITAPTDIVGTASDDNLYRYTLAQRAVGDEAFVEFAVGYASVTGGVLGQFDPTLLVNGPIEVRLRVEDLSGNFAEVLHTYTADGGIKVGNFTVSFNDMTVPVSGIPVTIVRTYDSRIKTQGDFGIGWKLELASLKVEESAIMGKGWEQLRTGSLAFPTYVLRPRSPRTVSVTWPDGKVDRFAVRAIPNVQFAFPIEHLFGVAYDPVPPTTSTLEVFGIQPDFYDGGIPGIGDLVFLGEDSYDLYDPTSYKLTRRDGMEYTFAGGSGARTAKMQGMRDTNGNGLTFTPGGVLHSSGLAITFERDAEGRITRIIDPAGKALDYTYDVRGNLVNFEDREENDTQFRYDRTHYLTEIIDPRGVKAARNLYDDNGRLIGIIDSEGRRTEFEHDITGQREVIYDALGNPTVHEYDARGNVTATIDALGQRTEMTYDGRDNELTRTDPLGNTTTRIYDGQDNLLSETDPLGKTSTYTYNSFGHVLTSTDPLLRVTANGYDFRGNLLSTTDPLGNVTANHYETSTGNLLATTDPLGHTTTFAYDGLGRQLSQTDAMGNVATFAYDASGNQLTQTRTRTLPGGGTETITSESEYDDSNRLVRSIDADGNPSVTEYNEFGKMAATVDALGRRTEYEYDDRGNQILTRFVFDGTTQGATFDALGRQVTSTDRSGRTALTCYDAVGRVTHTVHLGLEPYSEGICDDPGTRPTSRTVHDAAGRVIQQIDERGNVSSNGYDDAGRTTRAVDALGYVTAYQYNDAGQQISMTDANSHAFTYEYDAAGRRTRMIFPDGTFSRATYDQAGRRIAETDQAGRTTNYEYDTLGRLAAVVDALGSRTAYGYDEIGNRLSQTDAEGRTTRMEYDRLGRLTKRILPLGQVETFTHDQVGNQVSHTDFNGATTIFLYDSNNRLAEKDFPTGPSVTYQYNPCCGERSRAGGDTYEYDDRGRLIQDNKGSGDAIAYEYDAAGNRTALTTITSNGVVETTTFIFDELNRLETVTAPDGGVTTYTYDAVGNRASMTYPNGTRARYQYDDLNRLTFLINERIGDGSVISSYAYTLGPAGHRLGVVEDTGRTVVYGYDDLYRLTSETVTNDPGGLNFTATYVYDRVGNRLTKVESTAQGQVTTLYTYDDNDRLLTETRTEMIFAERREAEQFRRRFASAHNSHRVLVMALAMTGAGLLVPLTLLRRRRGMGFQPMTSRAGCPCHGKHDRRRQALIRTVALMLIPCMTICPEAVANLRQQAQLYYGFAGVAIGQVDDTTTFTYAYDDNGNTLSRSDAALADTYSWDFENRLVAANVQLASSAGPVTFGYDADGIRNRKGTAGVSTAFVTDKNRDYAQVLVESEGTTSATYVYGDDLVSMTRPGSGTSNHHHDGQLSSRQLSNSLGEVTDSYTYDAFGGMIVSTGPSVNTYRYAGEQYDPTVGFHYLRARYYDQGLGRFMSRDSFGGSTPDPLTLHKYLYAHANPVNRSDPSGLFTLPELAATVTIAHVLLALVGGIIGGIVAAAAGILYAPRDWSPQQTLEIAIYIGLTLSCLLISLAIGAVLFLPAIVIAAVQGFLQVFLDHLGRSTKPPAVSFAKGFMSGACSTSIGGLFTGGSAGAKAILSGVISAVTSTFAGLGQGESLSNAALSGLISGLFSAAGSFAAAYLGPTVTGIRSEDLKAIAQKLADKLYSTLTGTELKIGWIAGTTIHESW